MKSHDILKKRAKQELLKKGYKNNEIFSEYHIKINKKEYVIDLVGISQKLGKTGIECGIIHG